MSGRVVGPGVPSTTPLTWPARHRVHKYWGRKAASVVREHIERFSAAGERVLDPFAGSGVTVVEAAALGRRGTGFDINPFSARLGQALLAPPDEMAFRRGARRVADVVRDEVRSRYATRCRGCGVSTTLQAAAWDGDVLVRVRYRCKSCGPRIDLADARDVARATASAPVPRGAPDGQIHCGWQMRKLARAGVERWRELFTPRNFRVAAKLRAAIGEIADPRVRTWLALTLTASLAQLTRMIPDGSPAAGGPSWKINCYWLPRRWLELQPLQYFDNRVRKSANAIADLRTQGAPFVDAVYGRVDARALPLADKSVDYIFADPPYGGEGVQYAELTMLWCLWLGVRPALESEIAYNPVRGLRSDDYAAGLAEAFAEAHRVLEPGRHMTVTFANKDPVVWDALHQACRRAGFALEASVAIPRSAPSVTETNMPRAPTADAVLVFRRPR